MRKLIANTLAVVLLWVVVGPAALVAASGPGAHECCYRTHHASTTTHAQFENQAPSHECCRLIFTSQAPTVPAAARVFDSHPAIEFFAPSYRTHYVAIRVGSHPERAPPFAIC